MPPLAALTANSVNPILTILLVSAPYLTPRPLPRREFWARSALGLVLAVAVAESGKHFQVWPGHASFPSGHETYGLCIATNLAFWDRRWLTLGLPLSALLALALVTAHFHRPVDITGAFLVGPPCALLCQLWKRRADSAL